MIEIRWNRKPSKREAREGDLPASYILYDGVERRAVVSKRGVDDGNQKGGGFLQPAQESRYYYSIGKPKVKKKVRKIEYFLLFLRPGPEVVFPRR
jgi:hypothetical protein